MHSVQQTFLKQILFFPSSLPSFITRTHIFYQSPIPINICVFTKSRESDKLCKRKGHSPGPLVICGKGYITLALGGLLWMFTELHEAYFLTYYSLFMWKSNLIRVLHFYLLNLTNYKALWAWGARILASLKYKLSAKSRPAPGKGNTAYCFLYASSILKTICLIYHFCILKYPYLPAEIAMGLSQHSHILNKSMGV